MQTRIKAILGYGIAPFAFALFLMVWFNVYSPVVIDEWYRGSNLLESAKANPNQQQKAALMLEAGNILKKENLKHPYHAKVWMLLGYYYLEAGVLDSCIEAEKKAITMGVGGKVNQIEQDAIDILNEALARQLSRSYDLDSSLALIQLASLKAYDNPYLHKFRGVIFSKYGVKDSSSYYLEKFIAAQPLDAEVLANLAFNYYLQGSYVAAYDYAKRAYEIRQDIMPLNQLLQELGRLHDKNQDEQKEKP